MTDVEKQNDQEQFNINDNNISSLIEQIHEELIRIRQDNLELTEQLTHLYGGLCQLRQSLTDCQINSNTDIANISTQNDSLTSNRQQSKQRSDSEPNIIINRQRIITIIDDLQ